MVANNESGESVESEVRTSSGMFLSKRQEEIIARVEDILSAWTFLPEENGESMQILHYENGQNMNHHILITFTTRQIYSSVVIGSPLYLMYLSNVVKGGETVFPMWKVNTSNFIFHRLFTQRR